MMSLKKTDMCYNNLKKIKENDMKPDPAIDLAVNDWLGSVFSCLANSECPMPWFGIDIGGTLVKLVYFQPTDGSDFMEMSLNGEVDRLDVIHRYLVTNKAYGETGVRDGHLELPAVTINGRKGILHFIRFPTNRMLNFIKLSKSRGFADMSSTVCATGGGAHKYADAVQQELNIKLHKFDELESLIEGIEFVNVYNALECYYWADPLDDEKYHRVTWHWSAGGTEAAGGHGQKPGEGLQYPYLVVNVGSGVSIVAVYAHRQFSRVSGSSIGGGFFHGLCCLLCNTETFDEALQLASKGDNKKVDKLVSDIYGGNYDKCGLPGTTVAASFGHMISKERRATVSKEDLARAALVTVTNNIGSLAMSCAKSQNIDRILFVGNFLRVNPIAARSLSYAMDYWSNGTKKALFLQHEGYFGAVGCLEKLVVVTEERRRQRIANGPSLSSADTDVNAQQAKS